MQPKPSSSPRTRLGLQVPCLQNQGPAIPAHHQPALIHDAWAGWHYELPTEDDTVLPFESVEKLENATSRCDRLIAEFRVESASEASLRVSEAVAIAELQAYAEQARGVLVTRHDFDVFSVSLSSMVPFGLTMEQDAARNPRHPSYSSGQPGTFNAN